MNDRIAALAGKVLKGQPLSAQEGLILAEARGLDLYDLFYWANRIRHHFVGAAVHGCGIVAGKVGACDQDCGFCSQSAHYRTHVREHTVLAADAILSAARQSSVDGTTCFGLVNSGAGPVDEEIEQFAEPLRRIRRETKVDLCTSLGLLTRAQAQRLYDLGVRKYNHNLQTSRRFFPTICTTHTYDQRIETVRLCKSLGMQVCCGGLFGMGETWQDRVDLALQLRDLDVDIVPLNFLIPIPGTPLEGQSNLTALDCLKIVSLFRFLLADRRIKVSGGREVHLGDLQSWIFFAGANGFLLGNYLTTSGRSVQQDLKMLDDLEIPLAGAAQPGDPAGAVSDQVARHATADRP